MASAVQLPIPPFDYGSLVEWAAEDGTLLSGSVYGFNETGEGGPSAFVETSNGDGFEVALSRLRLPGKARDA